MQLPEVQSLGTDSEVCVSTHVGFLSPKKSSGDKRDQHWINLWEVYTLPFSMVFQDWIAAEGIHDITGHRKFIREKRCRLCVRIWEPLKSLMRGELQKNSYWSLLNLVSLHFLSRVEEAHSGNAWSFVKCSL